MGLSTIHIAEIGHHRQFKQALFKQMAVARGARGRANHAGTAFCERAPRLPLPAEMSPRRDRAPFSWRGTDAIK